MTGAGTSGLLTGSPGQFGIDGADVRQDRHDGMILVRDSKGHGHGHVHRFTPASWRAFVAVVYDREAGLDESGRLS